jgi:hypothetical protein
MIESLMFGMVMIALIGAFALYVVESNKEKAKLVNALIAKNAQELRDLNLTDKLVIKPPATAEGPDLMSVEQLSDEEFDEHIKEQLANE